MDADILFCFGSSVTLVIECDELLDGKALLVTCTSVLAVTFDGSFFFGVTDNV